MGGASRRGSEGWKKWGGGTAEGAEGKGAPIAECSGPVGLSPGTITAPDAQNLSKLCAFWQYHCDLDVGHYASYNISDKFA